MNVSFIKKLTESVSKGVSTATEKAQTTVEITRLNSQISGKRREIERLYAKIGSSIYEAHLAHDMMLAEARVVPVCDEITAIRAEIGVLDERVKLLRNEKDCVCGKRLPMSVRFCSYCGHEFPPPPEPEPEPEAEDEAAADSASGYEVSEGSVETADAHGGVRLGKGGEEPPVPARPVDTRQICASCGTPLYADSHFCPACGQSTRIQDTLN